MEVKPILLGGPETNLLQQAPGKCGNPSWALASVTVPAAAHVWGLEGGVIARTLLLNRLGGLVFGWRYWKRGLEMAMLGHFCADLVLHVAAPLVDLGATP